jgi:hypothetical protein
VSGFECEEPNVLVSPHNNAVAMRLFKITPYCWMKARPKSTDFQSGHVTESDCYSTAQKMKKNETEKKYRDESRPTIIITSNYKY